MVVVETRTIPREQAIRERNAPMGSGDSEDPGESNDSGDDSKREDDGDGDRSAAAVRPFRTRSPEEVAERAMAANRRDRPAVDTPGNQSGLPGGGVGRREVITGSGVHPQGSGTAPKHAEPRAAAEWVRGPGDEADERD
jgi:hypothetical protein